MACLIPDWPAPSPVRAVTTTRRGGCSRPPFDDFNLADHVGDAADTVAKNRAILRERLALPSEPAWLTQVHGRRVVEAGGPARADAAFTCHAGVVCAVLTADCLPVLLCDRAGSCVAAAHAGWRGLAAGVLEATVAALPVATAELLAWLGPAIGPQAFAVGEDVRAAFVGPDPDSAAAFRAAGPGRWYADLYRLAGLRLRALGVGGVYGGGECTFHDRERFYSYRRDGTCGRMASLIWIDAGDDASSG